MRPVRKPVLAWAFASRRRRAERDEVRVVVGQGVSSLGAAGCNHNIARSLSRSTRCRTQKSTPSFQRGLECPFRIGLTAKKEMAKTFSSRPFVVDPRLVSDT